MIHCVDLDVSQKMTAICAVEPPRDCRRPFGLNYAVMGVSSSLV
jgi:hypothetical protein